MAPLGGTIKGIQNFQVNKRGLDISSAKITDIGQLRVYNESWVYFQDSQYESNTAGVFITKSNITTNNLIISNITDGNYAGLTIHNSPYSTKLLLKKAVQLNNLKIADNSGIGLNVTNSFIHLNNVNIHHNGGRGIFHNGTGKIIVMNGSKISQNGQIEIEAPFVYFPEFSDINYYQLPKVEGGQSNQLLLNATGSYTTGAKIDCSKLYIDYSNSLKFFPSISAFNFAPIITTVSILNYNNIIDKIILEQYSEAISAILVFLNTPAFDNTIEAIKLLGLLPYVINAEVDDEVDALLAFLESSHSQSKFRTNELYVVLANVYQMHEMYTEAIEIYQRIIDNPDDIYQQYQAEIDQAYCYYMLSSSKTRNLPLISKRKPITYNEYMAARKELLNNIQNITDNKIDQNVPATSTLTISNYPNPFNPETSINFNLPSESKVKIEIFNVKGQKIKILVDQKFTSGNHKVVWDGTNQSNQTVGSGVYFYKVQSENQTATNKMLLIK